MTPIDVQRILTVRGFPIGDAGIKKFQKAAGLTQDGIVGPKTSAALLVINKKGMLNSAQKFERYGQPGTVKDFIRIKSPYPLRVAWDLKTVITGFEAHKKIAVRLIAAMTEILAVYGLAEIQRLGIDLYGGCYNFRRMRGGASWSSHAWAIAVDWDPERNTLHETKETARFARPEYFAMLYIYYKHGFVAQGIEKDFDFMHIEDAP